jgi:pimeloyl-ACP methyl ester carboxylesterase
MGMARVFLRRLGYDARGLGLGVNLEPRDRRIMSVDDALAFRSRMAGRVARRLREITDEVDEPVSLLGWSMGGLYALDAARAEPGCVRRVVTLGSPFGDPRGTSLFSLLRRLNRSDVPIESQDFAGWLDRSTAGDVRVPIAILYSPRDGIVAPAVAQLPDHPSIECIAVDSSHVGFAVNPDALRRVAELLAR